MLKQFLTLDFQAPKTTKRALKHVYSVTYISYFPKSKALLRLMPKLSDKIITNMPKRIPSKMSCPKFSKSECTLRHTGLPTDYLLMW